jgi:hypothetical protein
VYPVSLGFAEAETRIKRLIANGHYAEALITSVFSFEKTMRRALRFFAVSRGFTSKQAEVLFANRGFQDLKGVWFCFDPKHQSLPELLGNGVWQRVPAAVTMRNKLAHGERVYKLKDCKTAAEHILVSLNVLREKLLEEVSFDGWSRLPVRRNSALGWSRAPVAQANEVTPRVNGHKRKR